VSSLGKKNSYQIQKVMNNNVILAVDLKTNREMVLIGKGLGFGKKDRMIVSLDDNEIEKSFQTAQNKDMDDYVAMLSQRDEEVLDAIKDIILLAEKTFGKLNDHLLVVLTDHVEFAIKRIKMGMEIDNPFLQEIKVLYPQEYEIGIKGAEIIKKRLDIEISEDEIGFIALYLYSARQNKTIGETVKDTRLLREAVEIIEKALNYRIDPEGLDYIRLINHLNYTVTSARDKRSIKNPLLDTVSKRFKFSFEIARKIASHFEQNQNIKISEDAIGFMAIHIERIRQLAEMKD